MDGADASAGLPLWARFAAGFAAGIVAATVARAAKKQRAREDEDDDAKEPEKPPCGSGRRRALTVQPPQGRRVSAYLSALDSLCAKASVDEKDGKAVPVVSIVVGPEEARTLTEVRELLRGLAELPVDTMPAIQAFLLQKYDNYFDEGVDEDIRSYIETNYLRPSTPSLLQVLQKSKSPSGRIRSAVQSARFQNLRRSRSQSILRQKIKFTPPCLEALNKVDQWDFDLFSFLDHCNGQPLRFIFMYLLDEKYGLIGKLHLDEEKLDRFIVHIEQNYLPNPYHNAVHATDIVQTMHFLMWTVGVKDMITDLDILAVLIAAAGHDVDHPGVSNPFLVKTNADLAVRYNNRSVLENHHACTVTKLLLDKETNFMKDLSDDDQKYVRSCVIEMILATDMAEHFPHLSRLERRLADREAESCPIWDCTNCAGDRIEMLNCLIHAADIGNPARPRQLMQEWAQRVITEFYGQGDKEKELGLSASPFCDRQALPDPLLKCQYGFAKNLVRPLFVSLTTVLPNLEHVLSTLDGNILYWEERQPSE